MCTSTVWRFPAKWDRRSQVDFPFPIRPSNVRSVRVGDDPDGTLSNRWLPVRGARLASRCLRFHSPPPASLRRSVKSSVRSNSSSNRSEWRSGFKLRPRVLLHQTTLLPLARGPWSYGHCTEVDRTKWTGRNLRFAKQKADLSILAGARPSGSDCPARNLCLELGLWLRKYEALN
jgi:hypothetical protein